MTERISPAQALSRYGRAWFEPDHDRRVEALRRCCTEDIVFVDGAGRYVGLDAVSQMIGAFSSSSAAPAAGGGETASEGRETGRSGANGVLVDVVTPIEELGSFFRYSFVWTMPDGSRIPGTDVCEVADDGRMKLITVWPANDDFPLPRAARMSLHDAVATFEAKADERVGAAAVGHAVHEAVLATALDPAHRGDAIRPAMTTASQT